MGRRPLYPNTSTNLRKDESAWFYQSEKGLTLVAQLWNEKAYKGCTMTEIPWKTLCSVVDRHRRIKRRARR